MPLMHVPAPRFGHRRARAALALAAALALPAARAELMAFDGQLTFQPGGTGHCAAIASGSLHAMVVAQVAGNRIEGYLYGEQLRRAGLRGNSPADLTLAYVGDTRNPQHLRLRPTGPGAYLGEVAAQPLLAGIYGCGMTPARIELHRVADPAPDVWEKLNVVYQLDNLAVAAYSEGLQGKVHDALRQTQTILETKSRLYGAPHPQLLPNLFLLSQLDFLAGRYQAAVAPARAAAEICTRFYGADSLCSALLLVNLGGALTEVGSYAEAEDVLRRALGLIDRTLGPQSQLHGEALNALSPVLIYSGRYAEAESALQQALALARGAAASPAATADVGISLNNLGVLYNVSGRYQRAEAALRQAIDTDTRAAGKEGVLTLISETALSQTLRLSGRCAEAEPIARSALRSAQKVLGAERQDHPGLSMALYALAEISRCLGRLAEAESLYRQAADNLAKYAGDDHPLLAGANLGLAKVQRASGHEAQALTTLTKANELAHLAKVQMFAWQVAAELMRLHAAGKLENRTKAIFYGKQAVNDLQLLRGNLGPEGGEAQQAFVSSAEVRDVYRGLAQLLLEEERPSDAQQVQAMAKEQEYFQFTQRAADKDAPRTQASLDPQERELQQLDGRTARLGAEYAALREQLRQSGAEPSAADKARLASLRKAVDEAQAAFEKRVEEIAGQAGSPEARHRRRAEINDFSRSFQGTLRQLGHGAVVLQYIVLDDGVAILLTTPGTVLARQARIPRAKLYEQIRALRQALGDPGGDALPPARALYELLVAPMNADLREAGARTVMLDLDDMLRYVPFAALHDGSQYLVDRYAFVVVTEAVRDKLAAPPQPDWSALGLGLSKGGPGYDALPYAAVELNSITGPKGILKGTVRLDQDFTEDALRTGLERSVPVVHIASHFQFTPGSMDDSFLLLGNGRPLSLAAIKTTLDFNGVELLTLSACETALGDDGAPAHGAEVEGLGAIAQQAGAKAVLATLWPVADASTAELMRALYQGHRDGHLDKADALREAQRALLHPSTPGRYTHPFFWAPFILMGNWL